MKYKFFHAFFFVVFLTAITTSCKHTISVSDVSDVDGIITAFTPASGRAVYFWKTRFDLNEAEQSFLKTYSITKMYVRMFDVDFDASPAAGPEKVIPVATTTFVSQKPDSVEIVPTVFITTRAIKVAASEDSGVAALAWKIILRVKNMMDYNDLGHFSELQLDCDWTGSTREDYYALCKETRAILKPEGISLSSTIRLHQLRQSAPPVDRGVLMLYNTGSFKDPGANNSIISEKDASAYLKGDKPVKYGVPIDFAYPAFSWGVWFRGNTLMALLHSSAFSDGQLYKPCDDAYREVIKDHILEGHQLLVGDRIRVEHASFKEIQSVKALVMKSFPGGRHRNVIYHLDSNNLNDYTADEIKSIFDD